MSFSGTKGYITKPKPGIMLNPIHPLSRGLVGHWLFNEGAGSLANDISGNGNHGRLTNMAPNMQGSGWGGNKFGGGLQLDGTDDYINCGTDSKLELSSTNALTISTWVIIPEYSNAGGTDRGIIDKRNKAAYWTASSGWSIWQKVTGSYIMFMIGDGVDIEYKLWSYGSTLDAYSNKLVNITWTVDSSKYIKVYFNGLLKDTQQFTTVDFNNTAGGYDLLLGDGYTNNFFDSISHVSIYNRALPITEIKQLHHDPFCNLLQVPIRRYSVIAAPPIGVIMNQFQKANLGADLYNGAIIL